MGILGTVLLEVYSGTILLIFIEIGSYLTDKEQNISWHSFFWDTVYIIGMTKSVCMPSQDGRPCRYKASSSGATVSGYIDIPRGDEAKLQEASATVGPISVAIDANHVSFQLYKSG